MSEGEGEKSRYIWPDEVYSDKLSRDFEAEKAKREAAYAAEWPDSPKVMRERTIMNALRDETFKRLGDEAAKIIGRPVTMPMMPMNPAPVMTPAGGGYGTGIGGVAGAGSLSDLPMQQPPMVPQPPRREPEPLFPPMKPAIFGMLPNGNRFVVSIETESVLSPTDIDGIIALLKTQQKLLVVANAKATD